MMLAKWGGEVAHDWKVADAEVWPNAMFSAGRQVE